MRSVKQVPSVEAKRGELLWTCVVFWATYLTSFYLSWCMRLFLNEQLQVATGLTGSLLIFFVAGFLAPLGAIMVAILSLASFPFARSLLCERETRRVRVVFLIAALAAGIAISGFPEAYLVMAAGLIAFIIASFISRAFLPPSHRDLLGYCAKCGYDLTGNASGACPECGQLTRA